MKFNSKGKTWFLLVELIRGLLYWVWGISRTDFWLMNGAFTPQDANLVFLFGLLLLREEVDLLFAWFLKIID